MNANRRTVLRSLVPAAAVLVGGCTGDSDDEGDTTDSEASDAPGEDAGTTPAEPTTDGPDDAAGSETTDDATTAGEEHPVFVNVWNRNDEAVTVAVAVTRGSEQVTQEDVSLAPHDTEKVREAFFVADGEQSTYTVSIERDGETLGSTDVVTADHPDLHAVRVAVKDGRVTRWDVVGHD